MKPWTTATAAALVALAALLPVRATAIALAGSASPHLGQVLTGVWIFKAMLLIHALLLGVLPRLRPRAGEASLVDPTVVRSEPVSRSEWAIVGLLLAAGMALRLYGLGQGLWFDEILTLVSYVRLPLSQIISTFDSQNQHMLYSLMASATVRLFGESAWALRLPAVFLGVASLAALYVFARRVTGKREAMLAVALLTFSYHHVWFSQNARGYTGLLLWTLLGSLILLRIFTEREPGWRWAAAYGAVMALGVYTHVTALFVVAAHGLIWLTLLARKQSARSGAPLWIPLVAFLLVATFTLQLYALVLPQFMSTLMEPTMAGMATEWKDPFWFITETLRVLSQGVPGGLVVVALALLVVTAGVFSYARQSGTVAAVMLLPGVMMAVVLVSLEHNLWPRFFFFAAGFAVLIAVRGALTTTELVLRARGRVLATAALALVVFLSAATLPAAYRPKQDYAGAQAFIEQHRASGDAVVTIDMSNYVYEKYAKPNFLGVNSEAELDAVERSHKRTWFLYTFPTRLEVVQPAIWQRLQTQYRTAAEFAGSVGGGTIVVKVKP